MARYRAGRRRTADDRDDDQPARSGALVAALLAGILVLLAAGLSLLRQQGKASWRSFYAEDGSLLFQDLVDGATVGHLFQEYAGYLVLPPRLFSLPGAVVPVADAPAYFVVTGALITALLAAAVYRWTDGWVRSRPVRLALASVVVLAPAAGQENAGSLTNTIWAFAIVVPWAILARQRGRVHVAVRAGVVLLAPMGTPLAALFAPLAVAWWWRRRDRATTVVVAAYAIGCVAQLVRIATVWPSVTTFPVERPVDDLVELTGVRVPGTYLLGPDGAVDLFRRWPTAWAVGAVVLVGALLALAALGAGRRARLLGAMFAAYAFASFLGSIWRGGTLPFRFVTGELDPALFMRYSVPPTFLLASAFAVLVAPVDRPTPARPLVPQVGRWVFVLHIVLVGALAFTVDGLRGEGPAWRESLAERAPGCEGAPDGAEIFVPADATNWLLRIPCSALDPG